MSNESVKGFGYFGKVPARGDFIQANLPNDFVISWSEWLQAVIAVSKEQQDEKWLDLYLTSPVWHFALSPGVCSETTLIGTLMPSVDQVGRHFYFTIAKPVKGGPISYWSDKGWCQPAEDKILSVLDDDTDVVEWAENIKNLEVVDYKHVALNLENYANISNQLVVTSESELDTDRLLHFHSKQALGRYCIWWTQGSDHVPECTLFTEGLPLVSQFSAMLDGDWEKWGW
ncbi:type VI secretion system-associated protein TagF [Vibrio atypicus]|uniref:type VI secretion system-associated protein TagF n=1 Tax=Vibrio atypicus TaxID=558271 RepID=UPI0037360CDF